MTEMVYIPGTNKSTGNRRDAEEIPYKIIFWLLSCPMDILPCEISTSGHWK